eukprot:10176778-Heterocapsa_arctica.AAC.1
MAFTFPKEMNKLALQVEVSCMAYHQFLKPSTSNFSAAAILIPFTLTMCLVVSLRGLEKKPLHLNSSWASELGKLGSALLWS